MITEEKIVELGDLALHLAERSAGRYLGDMETAPGQFALYAAGLAPAILTVLIARNGK